MRSPDPMSVLQTGWQTLQAWGGRWIQPPLGDLAALHLPLWLQIPLALLLIPLGLLLLWRLRDLIPALRLLVDRLRELTARLWRLGLALLRELVWVDPQWRRRRHQRWRRGREGEPGLAEMVLQTLVDVLCVPLDWLASLGLQRLLRPDPACEAKEERRRREHGGLTRRLRWVLETHAGIALVLSFLRLLLPRLWLPGFIWRRIVHPDSYGERFPIRGMLWLSLDADVREVLERPETYEVVYGPRMQAVTRPIASTAAQERAVAEEEGNFLLGMQDTPRYWRDISNMRLAFRREDGERCRQLAERVATSALQRAFDTHRRQHPRGGPLRLNLPTDLVIPVAEALVSEYFGIPVPLCCPDPRAEACGVAALAVDHGHRWLEVLFNHIFYDMKGDASREACLRDAPLVRGALREIIRRRRQQMERGVAPDADDVLSRCLRLQRSGTPGMDDETLRVNLTGFLVGAMTPLINATIQVVAVLLDRPDALRQAREAARCHGQPERLRACVMETLRFWPGDPVIWRWTSRDSCLGAGSRRCAVPGGTLVMAWNSSAMFDPAVVPSPWAFRTDRPAGAYLHWGHGQHSCAGAYLNMAVIPGMLRPLLSQRSLERAEGAAGRPAREDAHALTFRRFELLVRAAAAQNGVPSED